MQLSDEVLLRVMEDLDSETVAHSGRVQALAVVLGETMGLTPTELHQLRLGAHIHDIGKKFIPHRILVKKEPLTPDEWQVIEMHPKWGYEIAETLGLSDSVKGIVGGHHLWANGQGGYPQEYVGTKPGLLTQIVTVADVVDAMTTNRAYRQALSMSACLDFLEEHSGTRFSSDITAIFKTKVCSAHLKSG